MLASVYVRHAVRLRECFPSYVGRVDSTFDFSLPRDSVAVRARHDVSGNFERRIADVSKYVFAGRTRALQIDLLASSFLRGERFLGHHRLASESKTEHRQTDRDQETSFHRYGRGVMA